MHLDVFLSESVVKELEMEATMPRYAVATARESVRITGEGRVYHGVYPLLGSVTVTGYPCESVPSQNLGSLSGLAYIEVVTLTNNIAQGHSEYI